MEIKKAADKKDKYLIVFFYFLNKIKMNLS
jgi:hypothetical protein